MREISIVVVAVTYAIVSSSIQYSIQNITKQKQKRRQTNTIAM